jgi:hypothetical protein
MSDETTTTSEPELENAGVIQGEPDVPGTVSYIDPDDPAHDAALERAETQEDIQRAKAQEDIQ